MKYIDDGTVSQPRTLVSGVRIKHVTRGPFVSALVRLADDSDHLGVCLHCPDMPCVTYSSEELQPDSRVEITYLKDDRVCVFDAMTIRDDTPRIDANMCTGCGLCASRCPVGAIVFTENGHAKADESTSDVFVRRGDSTRADFASTVDALRGARTTWTVDQMPRGWLERTITRSLRGLEAAGSSKNNFGLFVRNLFLAVGWPAKVGAQGDTSSRIDLVFHTGSSEGLAELESGDDLLSAVRRLIADVAIARSRYRVKASALIPCLVCGALPNTRSDFYEVLDDINNVLKIRVRVIPVAALIMWILHGRQASSIRLESGFDVGLGKNDLRNDVGKAVGVDPKLLASAYFMAMK